MATRQQVETAPVDAQTNERLVRELIALAKIVAELTGVEGSTPIRIGGFDVGTFDGVQLLARSVVAKADAAAAQAGEAA